jgi:hypothetical protein
MHINPESKLVEKVKMNVEPPNMPANTKFELTLTLSPKVADTLPTAIAFDAGSRKAVDSLEGLEPTPIAIGETAHDFTLSTLGGETVTLSKLKGSVVILDFWATWCGPCKMALPKLQEFATWAESSGQPIKVYRSSDRIFARRAKPRKRSCETGWDHMRRSSPSCNGRQAKTSSGSVT